jgi:ferrous-iron efflux pump FieF
MRDVGLRRLASYASLGVAVVLIAVKLAAWIVTGSVALLTSAVDALVDMAASLATLSGVRYAERPPDRDHRFGHGKGEAIAGFTQSAFLAGRYRARVSVYRTADLSRAGQTARPRSRVMIASLLAAAVLVAMQTWVVRQTASTAIAADRVHYLTDVAVTLAVLAALGVTWFTGWERADPAFALGISGYMLWNSRGIAVDALKQLLDRELPLKERQRIRDTVTACPDVRGVHDLRTRSSGNRTFVEFHLEVDGHLTIAQGHAISDVAETAVARLFPSIVEVTAHLEPAGIDDERLDNRVASV